MVDADFSTPASQDAGQRFGAYRTVRLLGRGGMGTVYEAEQLPNGERVALKVVTGSFAGDAIANERFFREGRLVAKVRHPNVVRLLDLGVDGGRPFFTMELLEGEPLSQRLAREGRLQLTQILQIFLPLLSATQAIHASGIVHRDLKPANVFLARRDFERVEPVVLDFGISRIDGSSLDEASLTRSAAILGTPRYLSPEQVRRAKDASPLSDQYSLGVMLFECATGQRPFSGGSPYEIMHAILTHELPPPSSFAPELPPEFDRIVLRAMHREPAARFPDVRTLGSALLSLDAGSHWSGFAREFVVLDSASHTDCTEVDARDGSTRGAPAPIAAARLGKPPLTGGWAFWTLILAGVVCLILGFAKPRTSSYERAALMAAPSPSRAASKAALVSAVEPSASAALPLDAKPPSAAVPEEQRARPRKAQKISAPRGKRAVARPAPDLGAASLAEESLVTERALAEPGKDDAIDPFNEN